MPENGHQERYDDLPFNELELQTEFKKEIVQDHFPVHREPQIDTLDEPVIIETAYPGWQHGGDRYPAIPDSPEETTEELIDTVKAGAVAVHVHPRNEKGRATVDSELLSDILDPVFEECGDIVTLNHTWGVSKHADYISETEELLELGDGNKYCQGSVVLPAGFKSGGTAAFHSRSAVREGVRYLEEVDVKPIFQLYDTHVINDLKHHVLDTEDATWEPYIMNIHAGKHHSHAINNDPWSYINLIAAMNNVQATVDQDIITGVYPGGRNWLPILNMGLLAGATLFRVGIEDAYWKYPHKDELVEKNSKIVEKAVRLAEELGREVITDPDEAREILGMKYTSPR